MLSSRPDLPLNGIAIKYVLSLKYRSTSAYLMDNLLNWTRIRFQQIENTRNICKASRSNIMADH